MRMTQSAAKRRSFRASSRARLLATAVFIGAATASQPFLMPAYAQSFSFSNVDIQGNDRVDAATILNYAGISRGQEVTAGGLNDAYQRIMNSGLFETVELIPQGSTLVIKVVEYPVVNVISIEGNKRLKDEKLTEILQSKPRRIYSPSLAEADAAAIAEAYRVSGRLAASVHAEDHPPQRQPVDLVLKWPKVRWSRTSGSASSATRTFRTAACARCWRPSRPGFCATSSSATPMCRNGWSWTARC